MWSDLNLKFRKDRSFKSPPPLTTHGDRGGQTSHVKQEVNLDTPMSSLRTMIDDRSWATRTQESVSRKRARASSPEHADNNSVEERSKANHHKSALALRQKHDAESKVPSAPQAMRRQK